VSLKQKFVYKLLKIVLRDDYYTVESTLAFSAVAHGALLLGNVSNSVMVFSPSLQQSGLFSSYIVGSVLLFSGLAVVLAGHGRVIGSRCAALMAQFVGWTALALAVLFNPFLSILVNVAYITIAVLAAGLYLSAATGDGE
jgi:hypothetical protein